MLQATSSTPAISKYDLNVDFVEAGLGKLEPEKELRSSHVEFIRSQPIQLRNIHSSTESEVPKSLFEDESDADNEIDDSEEDNQLFEHPDTEEESLIPEDTPQMREVINSFLAIIPNNTLMSQLFRKVADTIILGDSETTSHNNTKSHSWLIE